MSKGIVEIFREIPDPRVENAKKHKLEEILTIAVLAMLFDCSKFTEMVFFFGGGRKRRIAERIFNVRIRYSVT